MKKQYILLLLIFMLSLMAAAGALLFVQKDEVLLYRDTFMAEAQERFELFRPAPITYSPGAGADYVNRYESLPGDFSIQGPVIYYVPEQDIPLMTVARYAIRHTDFQSIKEFLTRIIQVNNLTGTVLPAHKRIIIPETVPALELSLEKYAAPVYTRGIYLNLAAVGRRGLVDQLPRLKARGVNAIVFDVKDIPGQLSYASNVPFARAIGAARRPTVDNMDYLLREMKKNGMYSIARVTVFRDNILIRSRPDLAIRSRTTGGFFDAAGERWADPTNREVQDYVIDLCIELARMGVDEIQLDYIRFPTGGNVADAVFSDPAAGRNRVETITNFLTRVRQALKDENVFLSIDIFGIVAWGKSMDIRSTGQDIRKLAPHCDVISPMLYPSHFNQGFDGYDRPGDAPYYFLKKGTEKVRELAGPSVMIRPWLQAFAWRVSRYDADYILEQIRACDDAGAHGYLFWNARSSFSIVYEALTRLDNEQP